LEVRYEAVRCPHCQSDVSGVRLLLQRIQLLEERITDILGRIEKVEDSSRTKPFDCPLETPKISVASVRNSNSTHSAWLLISMATACTTIVFSHWLLLFVFNANAIALRVLTIFLPIIFGSLAAYLSREKFVPLVTSGFLVGVVSVTGMLGVTAWLDGVEWLPTSHRDQKEALEYVLAIWFGFSTGYFVLRALNATRSLQGSGNHTSGNAHRLLAGDSSQRKAIFEKIEGLFSTLTAMGSAGAALYTGLKTSFE
jgi:hypothetical protein